MIFISENESVFSAQFQVKAILVAALNSTLITVFCTSAYNTTSLAFEIQIEKIVSAILKRSGKAKPKLLV